jgi:hypothetical protein
MYDLEVIFIGHQTQKFTTLILQDP